MAAGFPANYHAVQAKVVNKRHGTDARDAWVSGVSGCTVILYTAMPEGMNVEISRKLSEQEAEEKKRKARWEVLVEIVEVAVLAIVAVATAWSGYQAAGWDGHQSLLYGHATADRFKADAASTYGDQELAYDAALTTAYLQARSAGDSKLEMLYVRRFTPDYRVAFAAWLKTDPFTNPAAPPGPGSMPQYRNPSFESAARLNALAAATFN